MAYKRKYEKGEPITSLNELTEQEFIYCNHKVLHKGWFCSWPLRLASNAIQQRRLFKAVLKEDSTNAK